VREIEGLPLPLVDIDVFANAKIGLGLVYTHLAKYGKAEGAISDAARMGVHASGSTLMKAYRSEASLVSAQGKYIEAWAFLLQRHKLDLNNLYGFSQRFGRQQPPMATRQPLWILPSATLRKIVLLLPPEALSMRAVSHDWKAWIEQRTTIA
jgi:hypothetical protein